VRRGGAGMAQSCRDVAAEMVADEEVAAAAAGDSGRREKLGLGFHVRDGGDDDVARSDWLIW